MCKVSPINQSVLLRSSRRSWHSTRYLLYTNLLSTIKQLLGWSCTVSLTSCRLFTFDFLLILYKFTHHFFTFHLLDSRYLVHDLLIGVAGMDWRAAFVLPNIIISCSHLKPQSELAAFEFVFPFRLPKAIPSQPLWRHELWFRSTYVWVWFANHTSYVATIKPINLLNYIWRLEMNHA